MEHSRLAYLAKMANQIGQFFEAQSPHEPQASAMATAAHLKLFWAPLMRSDLIAATESGDADLGLSAVVTLALREHKDDLLSEGAHVPGAAAQRHPEGGGDAG